MTTFKLPNSLITDADISYTTRKMGAVLYAHRNRLGACRKSLAQLASLAHCSVSTAREALKELKEKGYVQIERRYRYDQTLGRKVYDRYIYHCDLSRLDRFTRIPRVIFQHELNSSCFSVALYLFYRAGNRRRAFPSLRRIASDLWMGIATVCRAVRVLADSGLFYTERCRKVNCAFSCNSYFPISGSVSFPHTHCTPDREERQSLFHPGGVIKISKQLLRLKITKIYILRKERKTTLSRYLSIYGRKGVLYPFLVSRTRGKHRLRPGWYPLNCPPQKPLHPCPPPFFLSLGIKQKRKNSHTGGESRSGVGGQRGAR